MTKINYFLLAICLFAGLGTTAQTLKYEDLKNGKPSGTFDTYITKNGDTITAGKILTIGKPSGTNGLFVYIESVNVLGKAYFVGAAASNTTTEVKKIKVIGTKRTGWKVVLQTKGVTGLENYFFYIEDAIENGEIKSDVLSSDQALEELKKAKDKLDLGLMTKEDYEAKKAELSKYIK